MDASRHASDLARAPGRLRRLRRGRAPETELSHLAGYAGARCGGRLDRDTARLLDGLGHTVRKRWREPDEGIWKGRSGRFHHTHSNLLCWVALDRLIQTHEAGQVRVCVDEFRTERRAIRAEIEARGYKERLHSYAQTFDGDELDASLLLVPIYGYLDGSAISRRRSRTSD